MASVASVLSLTDDCLLRIVSFIDDPCSFYTFVLTCQRFHQVTMNAKSVLHPKLLQAKAENCVKRYVVAIGDDYDKCCKLVDLLRDSGHLTASKRSLTYEKVIDVWQRSGPVVAKLFTWLRNRETSREEGEPRATCYTERGKFTLDLPSCAKKMQIETSHFGDYGHNYDRELSIRVICGDLDVKSERFSSYHPEDYMYMDEEVVAGVVKAMKEVIAVLQKELGETVPPITGQFFIWLCFFFPHGSNLDEVHRLHFKDVSRNTKPNPAMVQPAIDQLHNSLESEKSVLKLVSGWEADNQQGSTLAKMVAETVHLLALRSEVEVFENLQRDAHRVYGIANDYDFKKLPKQLILHLILRTSLVTSGYDAGSIADKYVEGRASYRCSGGKVMKVFGGIHGDGASYPTWDEVQLKFSLPDGKVVKLEAVEKPLEIERLGPVTELVKESISQSIPEELIPKISNLLVAVYFLHALDFGVIAEPFIPERDYKLILSESEEEWSDEKS